MLTFLQARPYFAQSCEERSPEMFTLLILAACYGGWRVTRAALESLRYLPRTNDDMIFF